MRQPSPIARLDALLLKLRKNLLWLLVALVLLAILVKVVLGKQLIVEQGWAITLAFLGIPLIYLIFRGHVNGKQDRIKALADPDLIGSMIKDYSFDGLPKTALSWGIIWVLLCGGLAGLRIGQQPVEAKLARSEIMVALDVSKSMLAQDVRPNRMDQAKNIVAQLLSQLQNDRIGLIVFAGQAYVQMPLTEDFVSAQLFLEAINTDIVPVQGTSLAAAVQLAIESYPEGASSARSLIIITDGEDHEEGIEEALLLATQSNIEVAIVGVGTAEGGPIPENTGKGFKKGPDGTTVISKMEEAILAAIARAANGQLFLAGDKINLEALNEWILALERDGNATTAYQDKWHLYPFFFLVAGLLLIFKLWKS